MGHQDGGAEHDVAVALDDDPECRLIAFLAESDCLRLEVRGNEAILRMDQPYDCDLVFKCDDRNVLVADEATCRACAGMRLDYDNENDFSFVFTHDRCELN